MKKIIILTAAALMTVAWSGVSADTLDRDTPACAAEKKVINDCFTSVITEVATIAEVLEGIRTVDHFSKVNGFDPPLTGKETVQPGEFNFAL